MNTDKQSRPARGAWVEIIEDYKCQSCVLSRPARGAWVEMTPRLRLRRGSMVAPRKGRVG